MQTSNLYLILMFLNKKVIVIFLLLFNYQGLIGSRKQETLFCRVGCWEVLFYTLYYTVSPNKHGNSNTKLNLSTSAWVAGTQPLHTFIR